MKKFSIILLLIFIWCINLGIAQSISLPPSGDNQKSSVTQWIGLVSINLTYNSPDVAGPNGESRKGNIWGGVVPYGLSDNNFGTAKKIPWRAGANENTIITFSHDVKIEGKDLKAGSYGLHLIPGKERWIVIFSRNSSAWGSYFYDESDDALRVEVKAMSCPYSEWLTFEFIERKPTYTIAALKWDELMIPFKIEADVINLYLTEIRKELQSSLGFDWQNWVAAVNFCLSNNVNLDEALLWADYAISAPFVGKKNFTTFGTKANVLYKMSRDREAEDLITTAINEPSTTMREIHLYGRSLINEGQANKAMEVFRWNRKKYPDDNFTTFVGLARGYEALGKVKQASKNYRIAAENAPPEQKDYYLELAKKVEK